MRAHTLNRLPSHHRLKRWQPALVGVKTPTGKEGSEEADWLGRLDHMESLRKALEIG